MKKIKVITLIATLVVVSAFATGCANKQAVKDLANELESLANEMETVDSDEKATTVAIQVAEGSVEDFYSKNDGIKIVNDQLEQARLSQYADTYKSMTFEVSGNTITYTYVFKEGLTADAQALRESLTEEMVNETKDNIEAEAGVRPTKVSFVYEEADGTLITDISY